MVFSAFIIYTFFFAISVWLIPGLVGGVITALALRREKIPMDVLDVIQIGGQWMIACFLGGLVVFGLLIFLSMVIPAGLTAPLLIDYLCFGAGAAVIGARGAKIILKVLNYS
jgi:hypothetical protein